MGLIFLLSSVPGRYLGPGIGMNLLIQKFAHFSLYGILSVLFFALGVDMKARRVRRLFFVLITLLTALYAVSDEYRQYFIAGRYPSQKDVIIDAFGAATFLSFVYLWKNRKILSGDPKGLARMKRNLDGQENEILDFLPEE